MNLIMQLNNKDEIVSEKAKYILSNCQCVHDDLPCIHQMYNNIITNPPGTPIISKDEIPDKYFIQVLSQNEVAHQKKIIKTKE